MSRNGTRLDGKALSSGTWEPLPKKFDLTLTGHDEVLTLGGRMFFADEQAHALEVGWPRGYEPGESFEVGAEAVHSVAALRLLRRGNADRHVYVQVFRSVTVGASVCRGIRLTEKGVAKQHAEIVLYRGEWFVRSTDPEARTEVNGRLVGPDELVSLAPTKTLTFGETDFQLREVTAEDLVTL